MALPRRIALGCSLLVFGIAGCPVPWRYYPVSPVIEGRVSGAAVAGARLRLEVRNLSSPRLAIHRDVALEPEGVFRIEPLVLRVGAREFFKRYAVDLHFESSDRPSKIIWRTEWFRGYFGKTVALDCELQRPPDYGQPCRVVDAARHHWLAQVGELEFLRSCASCHGVGAVGGGPAAAALKGRPPDLTRYAARRGGTFDYDEIISWIDGRRRVAAHGSAEMPTWGARLTRELGPDPNAEDLAAARIDAVATYLESLQHHTDPELADPAQAAE